eukprot:NODE_2505_length_779_cov_302.026027_g1746_i0.p1 GENE.NODE_2505_length_779_cov_302.026027_g1746_i0~~NODE_2505_length_779_cov_302.026027_g1746_i0.p1  ORF type:complete len:149 (+),score=44.93 NODE_2505_length_779_cov_302.026027_g1746_i0:168-614(+)
MAAMSNPSPSGRAAAKLRAAVQAVDALRKHWGVATAQATAVFDKLSRAPFVARFELHEQHHKTLLDLLDPLAERLQSVLECLSDLADLQHCVQHLCSYQSKPEDVPYAAQMLNTVVGNLQEMVGMYKADLCLKQAILLDLPFASNIDT